MSCYITYGKLALSWKRNRPQFVNKGAKGQWPSKSNFFLIIFFLLIFLLIFNLQTKSYDIVPIFWLFTAP